MKTEKPACGKHAGAEPSQEAQVSFVEIESAADDAPGQMNYER
jgi:hypothetical protein